MQSTNTPQYAEGQTISLDHPVQCGEKLYFLDPDHMNGEGGSSGWYEVVDAPLVLETDDPDLFITDDDYRNCTIQLINDAGSELEAYVRELYRQAPLALPKRQVTLEGYPQPTKGPAMLNTQKQLKQLLINDKAQQQLKEMVTDAANTAAVAANIEGLRSQLSLLEQLAGWGPAQVLRILQSQQVEPPTCNGILIEKGQRFINLKPQLDTDEDDNERVTPAGQLWDITSVHQDGTIQAECEKTGGWIYPSSEELTTDFKKVH